MQGKVAQEDIPRSADVAIRDVTAVGASESLVTSEFLVDVAALPAGFGRV